MFLILRKNEIVIASYKTKFKEFNLSGNPDYPGWYNFLIHFNNDKDLRYFRGLVNKDSLVTSGFEGFEYTYGLVGAEVLVATRLKNLSFFNHRP